MKLINFELIITFFFRSKSCSLFIVLLIVLCQNSNDRIDLIIKLLDCAVVLFDKINNLFAFSYIMEAFNHPQVNNYF
jgi:hypothetical protein